jgi:hypothetical protein
MKKFILFFGLIFIALSVIKSQTTYTWNVSSGDFLTPTSWSPSRTTPLLNDILVFNGSVQATPTVTNIRSQSIGKLRVINNATVTFSTAIPDTGTGTIARSGTTVTGTGSLFTSQLRVGDQLFTNSTYTYIGEIASISSNTSLVMGSAGTIAASTPYLIYPRLTIKTASTTLPSLEILNGSSLIINCSIPGLGLFIDTGAFANISGLISFNERGRIYANDTNSIRVKNLGELKVTSGFLGNIFGLVGIANIALFDSGSVYRHQGGANPFGLTAPATKVTFSPSSSFIFESTTGGPSFSGRTYANFIYRSPSSYTAAGSGVTTVENIQVDSGQFTTALTGIFNIKGSITVNTPGTLVMAATTGSPNYIFNGTRLQAISGSGTLNVNATSTSICTFTLSNNFGFRLDRNFSIGRGRLVLDSGAVNLNSNTLTVGYDSVNYGSILVNTGYLTGTGTFTRWMPAMTYALANDTSRFPFGTSTSSLRDLWISGTLSAAGTISVSHNNVAGNTNFTTPFSDNATNSVTVNVRQNSNWVVSTANGFSGTGLSLRVLGTGTATQVTNTTNLRLTLASGVAPGTAVDGGGTSTNPQANRSNLSSSNLNNTFYIGGNSTQNPLPINLINFTANKLNPSAVSLFFTTGSELNSDRFEIEKSNDGSLFSIINTLTAKGNSSTNNNYKTIDHDAFKNNNTIYYRLKMIDMDGSFQYSNIISLNKDEVAPITLSSIAPNPSNGEMTLTLLSGFAQQSKIEILDLKGSIIYTLDKILIAGENSISVNINSINNGIYFIRLTSENEVKYFKIVKN